MASIVLVDDHVVVMDALHYLIDHTTRHKISGKYKTGNDFLLPSKVNPHAKEIYRIMHIKLPSHLMKLKKCNA